MKRQFSRKEFELILFDNNYYLDRIKGSHCIYINDSGCHISVPIRLNRMVARRLIKENNLVYGR